MGLRRSCLAARGLVSFGSAVAGSVLMSMRPVLTVVVVVLVFLAQALRVLRAPCRLLVRGMD